MRKKLFFIILGFLSLSFCFNQDVIKMDYLEGNLIKLSCSIYSSCSEAEYMKGNLLFVKALVSLKVEINAFYFTDGTLDSIMMRDGCLNTGFRGFRIS